MQICVEACSYSWHLPRRFDITVDLSWCISMSTVLTTGIFDMQVHGGDAVTVLVSGPA